MADDDKDPAEPLPGSINNRELDGSIVCLAFMCMYYICLCVWMLHLRSASKQYRGNPPNNGHQQELFKYPQGWGRFNKRTVSRMIATKITAPPAAQGTLFVPTWIPLITYTWKSMQFPSGEWDHSSIEVYIVDSDWQRCVFKTLRVSSNSLSHYQQLENLSLERAGIDSSPSIC